MFRRHAPVLFRVVHLFQPLDVIFHRMTPALAFFYGGLVARKNLMNTLYVIHDDRFFFQLDL